jgi:hypothetical protein
MARTTAWLGRAFDENNRLQTVTFLFCVLFGLAMIAETQPAGDGGWFWYGSLLHSGRLLYSDLHLALQPLFVLETSLTMALLGKGWLVSKLPAVLHLLAYCVAWLVLVRQSGGSDGKKAIVLGCAFFLSIFFEAYQFDDYHVLADCFQLYSLIALLSLRRARNVSTGLALAALLGTLSGLALMTRLNDGAALFVGVGLAIVCLAPTKRLLSLVLFSLMAGLTAAIVVALTGDTLHNYAMYSILKAAGSKGGAGSVLAYPLQLPINTLVWLKIHRYDWTVACALGLVLLWVFPLRLLARRRGGWGIPVAAATLVLLLFDFHRVLVVDTSIDFVQIVSAVAVLLAYALGLLVLTRFLHWLLARGGAGAWDRREILLLIPLGQFASGSMSSGGFHLGLYGPVAVLIVLLSICSPIRFRAQWARSSLLAIVALLLCSAFLYRVDDPYSWHTYRELPMFTGRTWYRHPDYGPMILDKDLLQMIQPVCAKVTEGGPPDELLSLPFPFANYFCSVPPWHDYVQTFFDTSSKETIRTLMGQLQQSPPKWIFYQRQLHTLRLHELAFNRAQPLQQRYLDQMIEQKLMDGSWQVVYTSDFGNRPPWDNEWILIQTRP